MKYEEIPANVKKQYTTLYGPFHKGDYAPGDTIKASGVSGEVLWSFQDGDRISYVVGGQDSFPTVIAANEVIA